MPLRTRSQLLAELTSFRQDVSASEQNFLRDLIDSSGAGGGGEGPSVERPIDLSDATQAIPGTPAAGGGAGAGTQVTVRSNSADYQLVTDTNLLSIMPAADGIVQVTTSTGCRYVQVDLYELLFDYYIDFNNGNDNNFGVYSGTASVPAKYGPLKTQGEWMRRVRRAKGAIEHAGFALPAVLTVFWETVDTHTEDTDWSLDFSPNLGAGAVSVKVVGKGATSAAIASSVVTALATTPGVNNADVRVKATAPGGGWAQYVGQLLRIVDDGVVTPSRAGTYYAFLDSVVAGPDDIRVTVPAKQNAVGIPAGTVLTAANMVTDGVTIEVVTDGLTVLQQTISGQFFTDSNGATTFEAININVPSGKGLGIIGAIPIFYGSHFTANPAAVAVECLALPTFIGSWMELSGDITVQCVEGLVIVGGKQSGTGTWIADLAGRVTYSAACLQVGPKSGGVTSYASGRRDGEVFISADLAVFNTVSALTLSEAGFARFAGTRNIAGTLTGSSLAFDLGAGSKTFYPTGTPPIMTALTGATGALADTQQIRLGGAVGGVKLTFAEAFGPFVGTGGGISTLHGVDAQSAIVSSTGAFVVSNSFTLEKGCTGSARSATGTYTVNLRDTPPAYTHIAATPLDNKSAATVSITTNVVTVTTRDLTVDPVAPIDASFSLRVSSNPNGAAIIAELTITLAYCSRNQSYA